QRCARRRRRNRQDRDLRRDARERVVEALRDRRIRLVRARVVVVAERLLEASHLLVAARDIEDYVLVRREPVREQEVLERGAIVALLVLLVADLEVELGLVRDASRVCGARREDREKGEQGRDPGPRRTEHGRRTIDRSAPPIATQSS